MLVRFKPKLCVEAEVGIMVVETARVVGLVDIVVGLVDIVVDEVDFVVNIVDRVVGLVDIVVDGVDVAGGTEKIVRLYCIT